MLDMSVKTHYVRVKYQNKNIKLKNYFVVVAYVMTTGATLLVIIDLALLLGMFRACNELLLTERLSSAMSPVC